MSYTFSFDASLKINSKSRLSGFLNHFDREHDEPDVVHSNESIDPSRTHENMTLVFDSSAQNHLSMAKSHADVKAAIYDRLGDAIDMETNTYKATGKSVRKDAVLAFGMIMQLDPQYYKDKQAEINSQYDPDLYPEENKKAYRKMVDRSASLMLGMARKQFGEENIVAMTIHLDETNPHVHFLMTPITDDGRLSQKEFITSPKLKYYHNEFRKALRGCGYDIDLERKTPLNAKRLSERDYKELCKAQETLEQLETDKNTLEKEKREFEANMTSQRQALDEQYDLQQEEAKKLAETRSNLRDKAKEIDEDLQTIRTLKDTPMDATREACMRKFMKRYNIGGKSLLEIYTEEEPSMIQQEEKLRRENERMLAELERKYHINTPSMSYDDDFIL